MSQLSGFLRGWHLSVFLIGLCFLARSDRALGEPRLVDEEVINKWKTYERFSRRLQGTALKRTTPDSAETNRVQMVFKQNLECILSCFSDEQSSTELCRIGNPRYAASIKRSKSDSSQAVLDKFTQDPQGRFPGYSGEHVSVFDLTLPLISPHFAVGTIPLYRFVTDPSNTILKTSKESENGHELVRIDYSYLYSNPKTGSKTRGRGSMFLDPSRCWCVRRLKSSSTMTTKGSPTMDQEHEKEFEVFDHPSGFPLIKTQVSRDNLYPYKTKKRLLSKTRIDYEWEVNDNVPDSEFTLSAFGLPEPGGEEPVKKPTPLYIWILAAAGVCAALALGCRYLVRRGRLKPAA